MSGPKNLLFLFSDQHAARAMGCAGDTHAITPNLDALAAKGVRMENAYCPSPICVPSRMSMLTACHPSNNECWTNDDVLRGDRPTWLHAMGAAGLNPGLVGRMHAVGPDQTRGYAWRKVGDHSPNFPGVPWHDMGVLDGAAEPNPVGLEACGAGRSAYETKDHDTTAAALDTLDELAATGNLFCLTVGFMLPHAPYVAARKWIEHFENTLPPPAIPPGADEHPWIAWWRDNRGITDVPDRQSRQARAAYWGLVATLDEMIGKVLHRLDALGLTDDTLVVYASDHGDHVGERGLWWKHTFFDESARIPMILSHPATLPQGKTNTDLVSLIDLSQTMLHAMGAQQLPHTDGRSFWGRVTGTEPDWDQTVFSEYCTDAVPYWTGGRAVQHRMVRQENWKLHYYAGEPPLLFDLSCDAEEQNDLSRDPAHADTLGRLTALVLRDWNPDAIRETMQIRRDRKDVMAAWAGKIRPLSTHLWALDAAMNRLDNAS